MSLKKIYTIEEAIKAREGCKLVVTNGCFDILHRGHVEYLNESKKLGDKLFVLLNSDESVKKLKGETRPINNQEDRAYMLANLECVDGVIIFNGTNCANELLKLKPNVYTKGGDYFTCSLQLDEKVALVTINASVHIIPKKRDYSTTGIIKKIKNV